jgi:hypothetical protein
LRRDGTEVGGTYAVAGKNWNENPGVDSCQLGLRKLKSSAHAAVTRESDSGKLKYLHC